MDLKALMKATPYLQGTSNQKEETMTQVWVKREGWALGTAGGTHTGVT